MLPPYRPFNIRPRPAAPVRRKRTSPSQATRGATLRAVSPQPLKPVQGLKAELQVLARAPAPFASRRVSGEGRT